MAFQRCYAITTVNWYLNEKSQITNSALGTRRVINQNSKASPLKGFVNHLVILNSILPPYQRFTQAWPQSKRLGFFVYFDVNWDFSEIDCQLIIFSLTVFNLRCLIVGRNKLEILTNVCSRQQEMAGILEEGKHCGVGDFVLLDSIDLPSFMKNLKIRLVLIRPRVGSSTLQKGLWMRSKVMLD